MGILDGLFKKEDEEKTSSSSKYQSAREKAKTATVKKASYVDDSDDENDKYSKARSIARNTTYDEQTKNKTENAAKAAVGGIAKVLTTPEALEKRAITKVAEAVSDLGTKHQAETKATELANYVNNNSLSSENLDTVRQMAQDASQTATKLGEDYANNYVTYLDSLQRKAVSKVNSLLTPEELDAQNATEGIDFYRSSYSDAQKEAYSKANVTYNNSAWNALSEDKKKEYLDKALYTQYYSTYGEDFEEYDPNIGDGMDIYEMNKDDDLYLYAMKIVNGEASNSEYRSAVQSEAWSNLSDTLKGYFESGFTEGLTDDDKAKLNSMSSDEKQMYKNYIRAKRDKEEAEETNALAENYTESGNLFNKVAGTAVSWVGDLIGGTLGAAESTAWNLRNGDGAYDVTNAYYGMGNKTASMSKSVQQGVMDTMTNDDTLFEGTKLGNFLSSKGLNTTIGEIEKEVYETLGVSTPESIIAAATGSAVGDAVAGSKIGSLITNAITKNPTKTASEIASIVASGTLGAGSFTQEYQDSVANGASSDDAFWSAFVAGVNETLFESFSIGNMSLFHDIPLNTEGTMGEWLSSFAKQVGKETIVNASEETFTEMANIAYDILENGDSSDFENTIHSYMENGYTRSEAEKLAYKDLFVQVLQAGVGGGLQGAVMSIPGGFKNTFIGHRNVKLADNYGTSNVNNLNNYLVNNLIAPSTYMESDEVSYKWLLGNDINNAIKTIKGKISKSKNALTLAEACKEANGVFTEDILNNRGINEAIRTKLRSFDATTAETALVTEAMQNMVFGDYNVASVSETSNSETTNTNTGTVAEATEQKNLTPVQKAIQSGNPITNSVATDLIENARDELIQNGVNLNGTKSEQRTAVKEYLESQRATQNAETTESTVANTATENAVNEASANAEMASDNVEADIENGNYVQSEATEQKEATERNEVAEPTTAPESAGSEKLTESNPAVVTDTTDNTSYSVDGDGRVVPNMNKQTDYSKLTSDQRYYANLAYNIGVSGGELRDAYSVAQGKIDDDTLAREFQRGKNYGNKKAEQSGSLTGKRGIVALAGENIKGSMEVVRSLGGHAIKYDASDSMHRAYLIGKAVAEKTGLNVIIFRGNRNLSLRSDGIYSTGTGTIYIDVDAGTHAEPSVFARVIAHELTHFIADKANTEFNELKADVFKQLKESTKYDFDAERMRRAELELNNHNSSGRTDEENEELLKSGKWKDLKVIIGEKETTMGAIVEEETVAYACEMMLKDNEILIPAAAKSNAITRFVKKAINWAKVFNDAFKGVEAKSKEAQAVDLTPLMDKWNSALEHASEIQKAENQQIQNIKDGKSGMVITDDGTLVANVEAETSTAMFNMAEYDREGRKILEDFLTANKFNDEEKQQFMNEMETVYKIAKEASVEVNSETGKLKYPTFREWQDMLITRDENGHVNLSCVVKNGEYALNIDFSTVCKKRKNLNAVINELIKRDLISDMIMNEAGIAQLSNIIKEQGLEVACALCFVDSKRYRVYDWASTYEEMWNKLVKALEVDGGTISNFNFTNKKGADGAKHTIKDTLSKAQLDALAAAEATITTAHKDKETGEVEDVTKPMATRIAKLLIKNPSARHYISAEDMISSDGFDGMRNQNPEVYEMAMSYQGSARPKPSHSEVIYNNEILNQEKFNAEDAYAVGGVRIQSFSDYMGNMFFDYVQLVADLAAKKLPAHAYTKELDFIKMFGLCGIKINMSLVPAGEIISQVKQEELDAIANDPKYADRNNPNKTEKQRAAAQKKYDNAVKKYMASHDHVANLQAIDKDEKFMGRFNHKLDEVERMAIQDKWADKRRKYIKKYGLYKTAGLVANPDGTYSYAWSEETFNGTGNEKGDTYAIAVEWENKEGYKENIGIIAVGASDMHCWKLLGDKNIHQVIPYHKSGLNPIVAAIKNIDAYYDYTSHQNTTWDGTSKRIEYNDDGSIKTEHGAGAKVTFNKDRLDFNFYEELNKEGATPKSVSNKYIDWCFENGYRPKFAMFAFTPYTDQYGMPILDSNGDVQYLTTDGGIVSGYLDSNKTIRRNLIKYENYYKVLTDFSTYDNDGVYHKQGAVQMKLPENTKENPLLSTYLDHSLETTRESEVKLENSLDTIISEGHKQLGRGLTASQAADSVANAMKNNKVETIDALNDTVEDYYSTAEEASVTDSDLVGAAVESNYDGQFDKATNQALNLYARTMDEITNLRTERNELEQSVSNITDVNELKDAIKKLTRLNNQIDQKTTELTEKRETQVVKNAMRTLRHQFSVAHDTDIRNAVKRYKEKRNEHDARRDNLLKVEKQAKKLMGLVRQNTDKKHIPTVYLEPVRMLFDALDLEAPAAGRNQTKKQAAFGVQMQKVRNAIKDMQNAKIENEEIVYDFIIDPDLQDAVDELAKSTLDMQSASEMNSDELDNLYKIMRAYEKAINRYGKNLANKRHESQYEVINKFVDQAKKVKSIVGVTVRGRDVPVLNAIRDAVKSINYSMMDGGTYGETVGLTDTFDEMNDGFLNKMAHAKIALDWYKKMSKELGIKEKDLEAKIKDGKVPKKFALTASNELYLRKQYLKEQESLGRDKNRITDDEIQKAIAPNIVTKDVEVTLSKAQLIELYCLMQREQARTHILGDGIQFADKTNTKEVIRVTENVVEDLLSNLTENEKKFGDQIISFFHEVSAWGNEASNLMYGYSKFLEEVYYPIHVSNDVTDTNENSSAGENSQLFRLRNLGMSKALTPAAHNAIAIDSVFATFASHIDDMTSYAFILPTVEDAMMVYNARFRDKETGNIKKVKQEMHEKYGEEACKTFEAFVKAMNSAGTSADSIEGLANKIVSFSKAASVGANLRVVIQQPTSIVRAAMYIDPKYLMKAMASFDNFNGKAAEYAQEHSTLAWYKAQGFYGTDSAPTFKALILGANTLSEKIREKSGALAGKADDFTWGIMYKACELAVQDENKALNSESEEFREKVNDRFNEVINRTQVVDTPLAKSRLLNNKSFYARSLTNYFAEPTKTFNVVEAEFNKIIRAINNGRPDDELKKAIGRFVKAIITFLVAQAVNAAAFSVIDAFRYDAAKDSDSDKKSYEMNFGEKYWASFTDGFLDNINPMNYMIILRDIKSMMDGYDVDRLDITSYKNLYNAYTAMKNAVSGDTKLTAWGTFYKVSNALGQLTGIPVGNVERIVTDVGNMFNIKAIQRYKPTSSEIGYYIANAMLENDSASVEYWQNYAAENETDGSRYSLKVSGVNTQTVNALADSEEIIKYAMDFDTNSDAMNEAKEHFYWLDEEVVEKAVTKAYKNYTQVDGNLIGNTKYTTKQLLQAVDDGDAKEIVDALYEGYGETSQYIKTTLTNHYKTLYVNGTNSEKYEIQRKLLKLSAGGKQLYSKDDFAKWDEVEPDEEEEDSGIGLIEN